MCYLRCGSEGKAWHWGAGTIMKEEREQTLHIFGGKIFQAEERACTKVP